MACIILIPRSLMGQVLRMISIVRKSGLLSAYRVLKFVTVYLSQGGLEFGHQMMVDRLQRMNSDSTSLVQFASLLLIAVEKQEQTKRQRPTRASASPGTQIQRQ